MMSAEDADKCYDADGGDIEEEWLYGDDIEEKLQEDADVITSLAEGQEVEAESDSESDDDVCVTIGDIQPGGTLYNTPGATPVNFNFKGASVTQGQVVTKIKGVDVDSVGTVNGIPVLEVGTESFEEKPWRKPGADLSDYFNYGLNEDTWKTYCEKQRRLRMGLEAMGSGSSKIMVQQGRHHGDLSKSGSPPPSSLYTSTPSSSRSSSSINVIGGQTGSISRVEGRRRHSVEGNNIKVISEPSSDSETTPSGPLFFSPNIPPPPFPPPLSIGSSPVLIPPPRLPVNIPPPGFIPPGVLPHSLIKALDSTPSGEYDSRSVSPFPFPPGVYSPALGGVSAWSGVMDSAKAWEFYARRDSERERERGRKRGQERDREREREKRERDREREHSPSSQTNNSEEERPRHRDRDHVAHGYDRHRDRPSREREDRHRQRSYRDEGRQRPSHSSSSSSRKRPGSEDGDSNRRHRHKRSKRSRERKEPSREPSADQENQSEPME
ncbi:pre-mRNA 3'-end-processing factor FIP1 isoform X1 [Denticeps clupeoides]|uniref:pre-mRNA 3'-end-processing factor FIP1 isoform X1 n=1 Tax=Denticeps clupeoides TaxID=299321 RepID=UPI0010A3B5DA|nr:pre-mRNA 3'-end-processing factor FIP1 isoform X1 [Denticeps clupeoides]XP_028857404.1 pre-mRNA 3'-end-processing factor FIP1 isoform X1 [Denticeps clupeoides]XP_028857405.1 pre-mRNA 3'-end-processing factor FIP1 isoform X1 [Denticeps clupeoides]